MESRDSKQHEKIRLLTSEILINGGGVEIVHIMGEIDTNLQENELLVHVRGERYILTGKELLV